MKIIRIILFLISLLFSFLALLWFGPSATISEFDDVLIIELFGFPLILISSIISLWLLYIGSRKLFLFPAVINTLAALAAIAGCSSGVIDILRFQNKLILGHQGNNYHSFDLFIIAVLPVFCVFINWLVFYLKRPSNTKATTI